MHNDEFKKCLVDLVKNYLTLPEDTSIQELTIYVTVDNYPKITLTLVREQDIDKVLKI